MFITNHCLDIHLRMYLEQRHREATVSPGPRPWKTSRTDRPVADPSTL